MNDERIVTKNLTCLGTSPDMVTKEELEQINDYAKPGNWYELHIAKGYCAWIPCSDPADHGPPADVAIRFDPSRRFLEIEVPEWINVKINKLTWA
jgi:hypothetical protein